jgi:lipopolysaccharide transport system permease protein
LKNNNRKWTESIVPAKGWCKINVKEIWDYRDLLVMFVKRDFVAMYKQTILGPIWFLIQPILTTILFAIVFGKFGGFKTNGQPTLLFYFSGILLWNYFSETFIKTSTVFRDHAGLYGKVYFPRLLMPLSIVASNLVRFGIQFLLFICILVYYKLTGNTQVQPNSMIILVPFLLVLMAGFALGAGMIISAMTTKYRDLVFLLTFGIQLFMYATPVIYPVSALADKYKPYVMANPITPVVETFRYAFLGKGYFTWGGLAYSSIFMVITLAAGIIIFNKVEKTFMDTV